MYIIIVIFVISIAAILMYIAFRVCGVLPIGKNLYRPPLTYEKFKERNESMKTNESIEFLERIIEPNRIIFVDETMKMDTQEYIDKFDEAISNFKMCAKHKKMWEDFKKQYQHNTFERLNKDECVQEKDLVGTIMDNFEKGYSSKIKTEKEKINEIINFVIDSKMLHEEEREYIVALLVSLKYDEQSKSNPIS